ncbi:hypothetical protein GMORB2_3617 [Geosmithia morbida]|uniref:Uncharacterized protein n=1 Tax=Geosmithia morbida TaxID=1094350 RepID=A0A9P5D2X5_9HYPO|nr:uncharacterized protein GMORB2_3617 [Geosmithia morbida]KAF4119929.1 hypothetical protein GMORB2_3617 [Geosmithia morbida]
MACAMTTHAHTAHSLPRASAFQKMTWPSHAAASRSVTAHAVPTLSTRTTPTAPASPLAATPTGKAGPDRRLRFFRMLVPAAAVRFDPRSGHWTQAYRKAQQEELYASTPTGGARGSI